MSKKVSIGIPVYNEIQFIRHTLNSVVYQDAEQVVISDNASTDGTSELCQEYAKKFPHINYYRFESTQPVEDNFLNCMQRADHEYFMIMGGHDLLSQNYVSVLRKVLDTTDAVLAYANPVHLTHKYAFTSFYKYSFHKLLNDDRADVRVLASIEHLMNCSLYYGLCKKDVFLAAILKCKKEKFFGIDHGVLSQIAAYGKMTLQPEATFYRIDPPREENLLNKWTRVMQAYYSDKYDSNTHIPELIPLGVSYVQYRVARSVASMAENPKEYLTKVLQILFQRWAANDTAFVLLKTHLGALAQEDGINIQ